MRRSFIATLGAGALVAALVPAASATVVPVDGNRWSKAGLTALSQGCVDRRGVPVDAPTLKLKKGPGDAPVGTHSAGWQTHGSGFGAGWSGHVKSPSSVSRFRTEVISPGQETVGHAVVWYHPEGDTGFWFGNYELPADTKKGWHAINAANAVFSWTHYTSADVPDRTGADNTIATHVANSGGDGNGAELGFVFGCNEEVFYADKLELRTDDDNKTFDLGGFRTRGKMWLGESSPDKAVLLYGYELKLSASLHEKDNGDRVAGVLKFQAKPASGGSWNTIGKDKAGTGPKATKTVKPSRTTLYRVKYDGVDRYEGSYSPTLKIIVKNRVSAHLVDRTVTKGHTFTAAGSVKPGKKTGILLQRYLGGKWKTIKKGQSGANGAFRISAVAGDTGNSYWRIKSRNGGGTIGSVSDNMKLSVSSPSGGGGGGGGSDDPEPPPPPPPPPPPEG